MRKLIGIILKILPLITIWQGLTSGGARLKPFIDTIKVTLTQYEVMEITKLVVKDFEAENKPMPPAEFADFLQNNFHSQYSVLAREIKGDRKHDLSRDIWGSPFQLILNEDMTNVKIASAGPDGKISNKDDIAADFTIEGAVRRLPARAAPRPTVQEESHVQEQLTGQEFEETIERQPAAYDEYDNEGYDRDGFDRDGYDRDGYDRNGMHRSEKAIQNYDEPAENY